MTHEFSSVSLSSSKEPKSDEIEDISGAMGSVSLMSGSQGSDEPQVRVNLMSAIVEEDHFVPTEEKVMRQNAVWSLFQRF